MEVVRDAVAFSANELHFREWESSDVEAMVRLFDTEEMNRWTPLPYPFSPDVAARYVTAAQRARERDGTLQLAICASADSPPMGEVLLFPSEGNSVEVAYAVGAERRGQNLSARAVLAVLDLARLAGADRSVLTISEDNVASQRTAKAAGFVKGEAPLRIRERKGFVLTMETWERAL